MSNFNLSESSGFYSEGNNQFSLGESDIVNHFPDQIYDSENSDGGVEGDDNEGKPDKNTMVEELIRLQNQIKVPENADHGIKTKNGLSGNDFQKKKIINLNSQWNFLNDPEVSRKQNGNVYLQKMNQYSEIDDERFKWIMIQDNQQRKNPNFTKFVVSAFHREVHWLKLKGLISQELQKFLKESKEAYETRGKRMIKMQALQILFGEGNQNQALRKQNRQILHQLLGKASFKLYTTHNPFAKNYNTKQHLLASKVYRLRIFCSKLTGRTQTK